MVSKAKRLAFLNNKGGVSKSTSIFHIAGELAHRGYKVLVIDLDPQINSSRSLLKNNEVFGEVLKVLEANADKELEGRPEEKEIAKTIYGFMKGEYELDEVVYQAYFVPYNGIKPQYFGVDVIASDYELDRALNLENVDIQFELDEFINAKGYDWVLIDMPPSNTAINDICFRQIAHSVICPFSSDEYSLDGYSRLIGLTRQHQLNVVGTFLSNYEPCGVDDLIKEAMEQFDNYIPTPIRHSVDIKEGRMMCKPMQYYHPSNAKTINPAKTRSAKCYEALVDEIIKRIGE